MHLHYKMKKPILRAISLLTLAFFLFSQVTFANPGAGIEIAVHREMPGFLRIDIPNELASLDGIWEAPPSLNSKVILHIQNAHANYGAQKKIKELLAYLNKTYSIKTIFIEGAAEDLNPDYLKLFPDKARNLELADLLAQQGELTGAELYLLETSDAAVKGKGIEDAALYRHNYEALKKVFGAEPLVNRYLNGYESRLEALSSKIFSHDLRRILADWKKFEKGHREFMPFLRSLAADAKQFLKLDLESLFSQVEWPQITRLLVLQDMEKNLDTAQALKEKDRLLNFLKAKRVSPKLIAEVENFKEQRLNVRQAGAMMQPAKTGTPNSRERDGLTGFRPRDVLEVLIKEAGPRGFYFHDYPAFSLYAGYLILKSELDAKNLFEEIKMLFDKILDTLAETSPSQVSVIPAKAGIQENGSPDFSQRTDPSFGGKAFGNDNKSKPSFQKILLQLYRDEELARKLLCLELSRRDWQEILKKKDSVEPKILIGRLKTLMAAAEDLNQGTTRNAQRTSKVKKMLSVERRTLHVPRSKFIAEVKDVQNAAFSFYEFARQRESVFYKKINAVMEKGSFNKAVLITGGFHTDGMTDLFREHNISYGILTPRLMEKSDERLYRNTMLQNKQQLFELSYLELAAKCQRLTVQDAQGRRKLGVVRDLLTVATRAAGVATPAEILPTVNESLFAVRNELRIEPTKDPNALRLAPAVHSNQVLMGALKVQTEPITTDPRSEAREQVFQVVGNGDKTLAALVEEGMSAHEVLLEDLRSTQYQDPTTRQIVIVNLDDAKKQQGLYSLKELFIQLPKGIGANVSYETRSEARLTSVQEKQFQKAVSDLQLKWWDCVFNGFGANRRVTAAKVLGEFKDLRAISALVEALKFKDYATRSSAFRALTEIKDERVLSALLIEMLPQSNIREFEERSGLLIEFLQELLKVTDIGSVNWSRGLLERLLSEASVIQKAGNRFRVVFIRETEEKKIVADQQGFPTQVEYETIPQEIRVVKNVGRAEVRTKQGPGASDQRSRLLSVKTALAFAMMISAGVGLTGCKKGTTQPELPAKEAPAVAVSKEVILPGWQGSRLLPIEKARVVAVTNFIKHEILKDYIVLDPKWLDEEARSHTAHPSNSSWWEKVENFIPYKPPYESLKQKLSGRFLEELVDSGKIAPKQPVKLEPGSEASFKKAQKSVSAMENFIVQYLLERGYIVLDLNWLGNRVRWYALAPDDSSWWKRLENHIPRPNNYANFRAEFNMESREKLVDFGEIAPSSFPVSPRSAVPAGKAGARSEVRNNLKDVQNAISRVQTFRGIVTLYRLINEPSFTAQISDSTVNDLRFAFQARELPQIRDLLRSLNDKKSLFSSSEKQKATETITRRMMDIVIEILGKITKFISASRDLVEMQTLRIFVDVVKNESERIKLNASQQQAEAKIIQPLGLENLQDLYDVLSFGHRQEQISLLFTSLDQQVSGQIALLNLDQALKDVEELGKLSVSLMQLALEINRTRTIPDQRESDLEALRKAIGVDSNAELLSRFSNPGLHDLLIGSIRAAQAEESTQAIQANHDLLMRRVQALEHLSVAALELAVGIVGGKINVITSTDQNFQALRIALEVDTFDQVAATLRDDFIKKTLPNLLEIARLSEEHRAEVRQQESAVEIGASLSEKRRAEVREEQPSAVSGQLSTGVPRLVKTALVLMMISAAVGLTGCKKGTTQPELPAKEAPAVAVSKEVILPGWQGSRLLPIEKARVVAVTNFIKHEILKDYIVLDPKWLDEEARSHTAHPSNSSWWERLENHIPHKTPYESLKQKLSGRSLEELVDSGKIAPKQPVKLEPGSEASFKKAQKSVSAMENFIVQYLLERGYIVLDLNWLGNRVRWYALAPDDSSWWERLENHTIRPNNYANFLAEFNKESREKLVDFGEIAPSSFPVSPRSAVPAGKAGARSEVRNDLAYSAEGIGDRQILNPKRYSLSANETRSEARKQPELNAALLPGVEAIEANPGIQKVKGTRFVQNLNGVIVVTPDGIILFHIFNQGPYGERLFHLDSEGQVKLPYFQPGGEIKGAIEKILNEVDWEGAVRAVKKNMGSERELDSETVKFLEAIKYDPHEFLGLLQGANEVDGSVSLTFDNAPVSKAAYSSRSMTPATAARAYSECLKHRSEARDDSLGAKKRHLNELLAITTLLNEAGLTELRLVKEILDGKITRETPEVRVLMERFNITGFEVLQRSLNEIPELREGGLQTLIEAAQEDPRSEVRGIDLEAFAKAVENNMTPDDVAYLKAQKILSFSLKKADPVSDVALKIAFVVRGILELNRSNPEEAAAQMTALALALGSNITAAIKKALPKDEILPVSNNFAREIRFVSGESYEQFIEAVKVMLILDAKYECNFVMPEAEKEVAGAHANAIGQWAAQEKFADFNISKRIHVMAESEFGKQERRLKNANTVFSVSAADQELFAVDFDTLRNAYMFVDLAIDARPETVSAAVATQVKLALRIGSVPRFASSNPVLKANLIRSLEGFDKKALDENGSIRITNASLKSVIARIWQAFQAAAQILIAA